MSLTEQCGHYSLTWRHMMIACSIVKQGIYILLNFLTINYAVHTTEAQTSHWHTRNPRQGSALRQH